MKFTANPHKGFLNSEILLTSSSSETIQVYCERTNMTYTLSPNEVKRIRFDKSGVYVLRCEDWEEKVKYMDPDVDTNNFSWRFDKNDGMYMYTGSQTGDNSEVFKIYKDK